MTINSNNFEAYLLDYLEGNLDPLLTADLMAFLAENPDFEKFIPDYDSRLSLSDTQEYPHKNHLKKGFGDLPEITPGNFDEFCIADCEGLLDDQERMRLSDYIAQEPGRQRELDLYRKIKLQPDLSLQFTGKALLKKPRAGSVALRYFYYAMGVAASVALLIMLVIQRPAESTYTEAIPVQRVQPLSIQYPGSLKAKEPQEKSVSPAPAPLPVNEPQSRNTGPSLATLEPISDVNLQATVRPPRMANQLSPAQYPRVGESSREYSSDSFANTRLGALLNRVDFWKTAETAISGFNYLTESQLSVGKTTDESGRFSGVQIEVESFAITGNKIK